MALRLSGLASLARRAVLPKEIMAVRGGGGGPIARGKAPTQALAEEDELKWDDGTANPEPCLDQFNLVTSGQALRWLLGGMAVFGAVGMLAKWYDPPSAKPFAAREFPFDGLSKELGKDLRQGGGSA